MVLEYSYQMNELAERIIKEGKVFDGGMIRVDKFLNHQVDIGLLKKASLVFATHFTQMMPTKVITVEASGIIPAVYTADFLNIPLVFAKKVAPETNTENRHSSIVYSFTKNQDSRISIAKYLIDPEDRLLIIDDFLARGSTLKGLLEIAKSANATVVGTGIVISKLFQGAAELIHDPLLNAFSLITVEEMVKGKFTMNTSDGHRYECKISEDGSLLLETSSDISQDLISNG